MEGLIRFVSEDRSISEEVVGAVTSEGLVTKKGKNFRRHAYKITCSSVQEESIH